MIPKIKMLIVDVDGDNIWFDAAGTRFLSISQVSSEVGVHTYGVHTASGATVYKLLQVS